MIDGNEGNYWDWGYAPSGNSYGSTNANTENDSNASDYGLSPRTRQENGSGHPTTMTPLGLAPAHFLTIDLGEIKNNIRRVWYLPRNAGTLIAQYEIWVSDTDIGVNPQADGAVKVAAGEWPWTSKIWLAAEFDFCSARYIQIRSFLDGDGSNLTSGANSWFSVGGCEINVDIYGDFDGTISTANLESTYVEGVSIFRGLSNPYTLRYKTLETLLYGEWEEVEIPSAEPEGESTKELQLKTPGAKQLLESEIPQDFEEKIQFQQSLDDMTRAIRRFILGGSL
jgi:hypothetical protein